MPVETAPLNAAEARMLGSLIEKQVTTPDDRIQFERLGYFTIDSRDSTPDRLVFNRTISFRDTWTAKAPPAQK